MRCQFFVGMLGERYGWVPDEYVVPDTADFEWVRDYPRGASMTELEMHLAALANPTDKTQKAFFYLRHPAFIRSVFYRH